MPDREGRLTAKELSDTAIKITKRGHENDWMWTADTWLKTIAALEAERDEAAGEAAACIDFLRAELGWECFRAEGMIGPDPVSSSEKNARLLMTFLDRTGHGKRVLDRISALEAELDDLKTKYHDLEKWVGSPYDHFDYLWKSIACCPDDQLESKALVAKKHMREITGVSALEAERAACPWCAVDEKPAGLPKLRELLAATLNRVREEAKAYGIGRMR